MSCAASVEGGSPAAEPRSPTRGTPRGRVKLERVPAPRRVATTRCRGDLQTEGVFSGFCAALLGGRLLVYLDCEVVVSVHMTAEAPCAAIECLVGTLPVTLLLSRSGFCAERVVGVADVVLEAVARRLANRLIPLLAQPRLSGALPEGAPGPGAGGVDPRSASSPQVSVCSRASWVIARWQRIALGADLARVAEFPGKALALGEHGVELVIGCLQSAGEVCALDGVRVVLASKAPAGLWHVVKAFRDLLAREAVSQSFGRPLVRAFVVGSAL